MSRNLMEMALIMTATAAYEQYGVFEHSCPRLSTPNGNIPSDKQKCQPKTQHEFTIKGIKIMAAYKKDSIKKYNHRNKLYKHVRLCRKRLLRQRYEDYAWILFQLEKDTEVFSLTHNTRDWTFEDWREFYLKKAKENKK